MIKKLNIFLLLYMLGITNVYADELGVLFEKYLNYTSEGNWNSAEKTLLAYKGNKSDIYMLWGMWYSNTKNPKHNKILTVRYLEKAVDAGDIDAQVFLIAIYTTSEHIDYLNYERGAILARDLLPKYIKLINEGKDIYGDKNRIVGKFYLFGIGVEKNVPVALNYYKTAANLGDKKAKKAVIRITNYLNEKRNMQSESK